MIKNLISFGIFMLIENTIILMLLSDLIRRVSIKLMFIRHPHLFWTSGVVFLAYLLCQLATELAESYSCTVNYLLPHAPIDLIIVAGRVFNRSMSLAGTILLWYYSVNWGFNLFKDKQNEFKKTTNS